MKKIFTVCLLMMFCGCFATIFAQSDRETTENSKKSAAAQFPIGSLIEAQDYRGKWYPSRIVDLKDGKYKVHYFGWSDAWDEWVTSNKVRRSDNADLGRRVEVEQNGVWYAAQIVDTKFGEYLVTYDGYDEDEWVKEMRVREIGDHFSGRRVEVLSNGKWISAQILDRRAGEFYVHYEGYTDAWNEWVKAERVRRIR